MVEHTQVSSNRFAMEGLCGRGEMGCEARVLTAALHALHFYCAALAATLIVCCAPAHPPWVRGRCTWRGQNVRGASSVVLAGVLAAEAAACALRATSSGAARVALPVAALALPAWLAAGALHAALWSRRAAAPLLYLAVYWMLTALSSAAQLYLQLRTEADPSYLHIYTHAASLLLSLTVAVVDCLCFYDEVSKRVKSHNKSSTQTYEKVGYKHNDVHYFSKITFFWINHLLYRGFQAPLEKEDLGGLPDKELSIHHYNKLKNIYAEKVVNKGNPNLWRCYISMVWPNFYLAGVLKLLSDLVGVVPPLGLAVIIQFIDGRKQVFDLDKPVTVGEFLNNGYVMLFIVTFALISQGLLSQNSTHLVTVEGTRLKTALQALIYDKCMKLAPWTQSTSEVNEDCPLLNKNAEPTPSGLLTNLVAQDTYNIMSCVWICHYMWAIPLKISLILYLLYTKLGISAIIGTLLTIVCITPLQFYLGKKISDNSKGIAKCTDHRISKMAEILQGINVIKLYVWEDLFEEKILNLREVELRFLNKDTVYWNLLTFSTQASTVLVTVISFTVHYWLGSEDQLPAMNVFAGLALFNQLTVPLLILPVTVLMFIQAMVSTRRIEEFLELPESNNTTEDAVPHPKSSGDRFNTAFIGTTPKDDKPNFKELGSESDEFSDEGETVPKSEVIVQLRNALFSWEHKSESAMLEVDYLDIPSGKLIMVVGTTGSGKSSFLSALLGEMHLEQGEMIWNGPQSTWYSGQPPWLVEGSVRENILMGSAYCARRYARVIRAAALKPDLQLLPEGDATVLGSRGAPLSGGQRVRVCVARALYATRALVALDEPLAALDPALARHVLARALLPYAREHPATVLLATNRLELMHYADMVIVIEEGRVSGAGGAGVAGSCDGALGVWWRAAAAAAAAAARTQHVPASGARVTRERERLVRALSRSTIQRRHPVDPTVEIVEVDGAHLFPEVGGCGRGSWRRRPSPAPTPALTPALTRQLSSPPAHHAPHRWRARREVRRALSADASSARLRREASLVRRLLRAAPPHRWTPKPLRRLLITDVQNPEQGNLNGKMDDSMLESTYASLTSNGVDTTTGSESGESNFDKYTPKHYESECGVWWEYIRACGAGAAVYVVCACAAQTLAVAADCWLAQAANMDPPPPQWEVVVGYWWRTCACAVWWGCAALGGGAAGGAARRHLHERLLHATLHAPPAPHAPHAPHAAPALHRHAHDQAHLDKKLPTAIARWAQLALLCISALLVNATAAPWSLLALLPSILLYFTLQNVYLKNARELQSLEARSAAPIVALVCETCAGAATIRAARLQTRLRDKFLARLDDNHNALLVLNSANRWLGLSMDLMGAAAVCVCLGLAVFGGSSAGLAGLAGAHALLLPAYLAHLAKCRADLDIQLAAVERVLADINVPQEDYREDYPIPSNWQRSGKIVFENVTIHHDGNVAPILSNVNFTIEPGEKVVICGRSGSGKSTLLGAMVGASGRVTLGRILVDGVDAARVPVRALRRRLVTAPQDATLFAGTLRENLDPLAVHTDEEIWSALTIVHLSDFVAAQPAGLECTISSGNGSGWSGGRTARLCVARAVIAAGNAAVLLLDEPAASLDAAADKALRRALDNAAIHRTTVTVAHRMSSIRDYSRALLVSNGRVYEQNPGNPAFLDPPTIQNDLKNMTT